MRNIIISGGLGAGLMAIVMGVATPEIETLEGTRSQAYKDLGGVLTVCSGHTGPDVVVGKVYSKPECSALTQKDAQIAASGVLKASPQLLYHPMQLASAISYSYNAGVGRYNQKLAAVFNSGDLLKACETLRVSTVTVNGHLAQGLVNRRQREYEVCMSTLTPAGLANVKSN